jgi:hypothetical protein
METQAHSQQRKAPFPPIGAGAPREYPIEGLTLRSFGWQAEDREVDFGAPRPLLETQILRCCAQDAAGRSIAEDFFLSLEVGERTHCLLIIAALDAPDTSLDIDLRCPHPACGEHMEISPTLRDIAGLREADDTSSLIRVQVSGESLSLRRPTGRDQLTWLSRSYSDEGSAERIMAQTLMADNGQDLLGEAANDDWLDLVSEALAAADPLVNFTIRTPCPSCGAEAAHHLDLGALALQRLQAAQGRLLAAIHTLAARYHWSEEQIMALPSWRRSYYLTLIEREGSR